MALRDLGHLIILVLVAASSTNEASANWITRRASRPDSAVAILNAFTNGCSSIGSSTANALADGSSIRGIVEVLKLTDACKSYQSKLTKIESLTNNINEIVSDPAYVQYRTLEEQEQKLVLELDTTTDPGTRKALQDALTQTHVQLVMARGTMSASTGVRNQDRFAKQTESLANYMHSLMDEVTPINMQPVSPTLNDCLKQSPASTIMVATNLLAIGGSFVSPIYGAAVAAVGTLINVGVEQAKEARESKVVYEVYRGQMPTALSCALESMSEHYCQANDAYRLIEFQAENYSQEGEADPLWSGFDLLGRRVPVLTQWLERVKNGVPPADPSQSDKQIASLTNRMIVDSLYLSIAGKIRERIGYYNAAKDQDTRNSYIRELISSIVTSVAPVGSISVGSSSSGTPFSRIEPNPLRWVCALVNGDFKSGCESLPDLTVPAQAINAFIEKLVPIANDAVVASLLPNWEKAVQKVYDLVNVEFAKNITANAPALLAAAFQKADGVELPPYDVLKYIDEFLARMLTQPGIHKNPRLPALIQAMQDKIDRAIWYLESADDEKHTWNGVEIAVCPDMIPPSKPGEPAQPPQKLTAQECGAHRLIQIFDIFQLKDGVQIFNDAISDFVRWDIQARIDQGDIPTDISEVLRAAGMDISIRMRSAGLRNIDAVKDDLNDARKIETGNLHVFREFFQDAFTASVKDLDAEIIDKKTGIRKEPQAGSNRPSGESLGKLCTLWLATSEDGRWPDEKTAAICRTATLYSIYDKPGKDGVLHPSLEVGKLESELQGKYFMDRVCAYQRYNRRNKLRELLKNGSKFPGLKRLVSTARP